MYGLVTEPETWKINHILFQVVNRAKDFGGRQAIPDNKKNRERKTLEANRQLQSIKKIVTCTTIKYKINIIKASTWYGHH